MDDIFNYAIIKVEPDSLRGEMVNIGIAVFFHDRIHVACVPYGVKLNALGSDFDDSAIDGELRGWQQLAERFGAVSSNWTEQDPRHLMLSSHPHLRLSAMGFFMLNPGESFDDAIGRMLRLHVIPVRSPRPGVVRLKEKLKGQFRRHAMLGSSVEDMDKHMLVQDYPIALDLGLTADFAMRNGRLRIIEAIDFRVSEDVLQQQKKGQAAIKSMTMVEARNREPNCHRSVVFESRKGAYSLVDGMLRMLGSQAEVVVDINCTHDYSVFMDELLHSAGKNDLLRGGAN